MLLLLLLLLVEVLPVRRDFALGWVVLSLRRRMLLLLLPLLPGWWVVLVQVGVVPSTAASAGPS